MFVCLSCFVLFCLDCFVVVFVGGFGGGVFVWWVLVCFCFVFYLYLLLFLFCFVSLFVCLLLFLGGFILLCICLFLFYFLNNSTKVSIITKTGFCLFSVSGSVDTSRLTRH